MMAFQSLDYCVLYHFPWVKKLEFGVGVGDLGVRGQGLVHRGGDNNRYPLT